MNKAIQDLKMEIETINKLQRETTLELENLRKRSGVIDASIINSKSKKMRNAKSS
jgi:prefoldin subunit 5